MDCLKAAIRLKGSWFHCLLQYTIWISSFHSVLALETRVGHSHVSSASSLASAPKSGIFKPIEISPAVIPHYSFPVGSLPPMYPTYPSTNDPILTGRCPVNFSTISSIVEKTASDCNQPLAGVVASVICCPQFSSLLRIFQGFYSTSSDTLVLQNAIADDCFKDIVSILASRGANSSIPSICSIKSTNLTGGSCPVKDMTTFEKTVNTSKLLEACSTIDPLKECCRASNYSSHQAFIQCLENYSDPSSPISVVLYTQNNSSYSPVLQNYIRNLRFNESSTPKPALIITALHVSHIQAAIICARTHSMQMKIRSGGHDYEGISYWSDIPNFFILDMFNFRSIKVNVEDESAWVQVGAILGEVYYRIAEKSSIHGFPAGVCPTVGVGGHFSGGGYGNMMRKYGLSVDNIIDAQIIDVNGGLLNRKSMGEDLFWAITGGGGSSYGVVLSYKIKLVRVPSTVTVFRVTRTYDENFADLIYRYQQIAADKLPEELFIRLTLGVANATNTATFRALFLGNSQQLVSLMNNSFPELALKQTDCVQMSWVESVLFWTDFPTGTPVNALLSRVPQVLTHLKRKSDYLKKPIPKQGLEFIFKKMVELQTPMLTFNPYGGRMAEISPSEKPFPHRAGNIAKLQYATNWNEDGEEAASRYLNLTRRLYEYMTPYVSMAPREAFLNYRDLDIGINHNGRNSYLEGLVYGLSYFKDNFNRLVKIKTKVDPDNFFRNEQSIPVFPWKK